MHLGAASAYCEVAEECGDNSFKRGGRGVYNEERGALWAVPHPFAMHHMVQHALRRRHDDPSLGFSLVELMVVSAIFVVLSAIVLANNARFGNVIILQTLAHDIALGVRESQIYGIAVRRFGESNFNVAYGMHFAPGNTYELFADVNANGIWDSGETVKSTTIAGGYSISELCTSEETCGFTRLDITFRRPEPDACISMNAAVTRDGDDCISALERGMVVVKSNSDDESTIFVYSSGQISVQ